MRTLGTVKYVERPTRSVGVGRPPLYPYDEVIGTLATRQAVLYPARSKAEVVRVVDAMRKKLRKRGFSLGRERRRGGVALWVEKRSA